jgi:lipopolysaccharide/colanic/teichoic acid biosynthesis glycosyltransferase
MVRSQPFQELLHIVLISTGFAAAMATYRFQYPDRFDYLTSDELTLGFVTSVTTFWAVVKLLEVSSSGETVPRLIDEFCMGTGLNLLVDAVLNYFDILTRSLYLIVVGGTFVVLLLGIARFLTPRRKDFRAGTLVIGYDAVMHRLAISMGQPILGMVGQASTCPPEIPFLGTENKLEQIIAQYRPKRILVKKGWTPQAAAPVLLAQRLRGVAVLETAGLYERLLRRIDCRSTQPAELLVSGTLAANSRILAIQAIYTNLIGMALLIVLSPLLGLVSLAVVLFSGPGPVIETTECSGFHNIPFRLMRFRTTRTDGSATPIGPLLSRLHLTGLPQVFNIVRGEMALFGPRPVRLLFARRLTELIPFYSMRLFVKPGIFGWARIHRAAASGYESELAEIEYDLYYIKQGSPFLDLEILTQTLFPDRSARLAAADFAVPAP